MAGNDAHIVDGRASGKGRAVFITDGELHVRVGGMVTVVGPLEVEGNVVEDAVPVFPDDRLFPGAIERTDSPAPVVADGDWTHMRCDNSGRLRVNALPENFNRNVTIVGQTLNLTVGGIFQEGTVLTGFEGFLPPAAERDDVLTALVGPDGSWTHFRTDSRGALWIREAMYINILSGSTDGRPVPVVAVATPGTLIHTVGVSAEAVWLHATNTTLAEITLTVEFGGVAAGDQIELKIPADDTRPVVVGQPLQNSLLIRAFASAAGINISGYTKDIP